MNKFAPGRAELRSALAALLLSVIDTAACCVESWVETCLEHEDRLSTAMRRGTGLRIALRSFKTRLRVQSHGLAGRNEEDGAETFRQASRPGAE
jgi:hypothetical protein